MDASFEAYGQARGQLGDDDLRNRATLAAEFALASWLSGALTHADQAQIDQAEASLNQLNENILAVQRYEAELQRAAEEAERRRIEEEKRQAEERQRQEEERRRAEEQRRLEEEQLGAAEDLDTTAIPVVDASAGPSADERDTPPTRTGETTDATETTDTHEKP